MMGSAVDCRINTAAPPRHVPKIEAVCKTAIVKTIVLFENRRMAENDFLSHEFVIYFYIPHCCGTWGFCALEGLYSPGWHSHRFLIY
jgi:hypothetical protein